MAGRSRSAWVAAAVTLACLTAGGARAAAATEVCVLYSPAVCHEVSDGTYDDVGPAWDRLVAPGACAEVEGRRITVAPDVDIRLCDYDGEAYLTGVWVFDLPLAGVYAHPHAAWPGPPCERRALSVRSVVAGTATVWILRCPD